MTLFEMLITISILAIVATVSGLSWSGYQRTQALNAAGRDILNGLHEAQGNAIARRDGTGDGTGDQWGVRITNVDGDNSTLQLFAGSTFVGGTVTRTVNFSSRIEFSAPAEGASFDFIYQSRSGKLDTVNSTALSGTCPDVPTGGACLDMTLYNLNSPADTISIRVWQHGGIGLL